MRRSPRRPFIAGNWKMNLDEPRARALVGALVAALPDPGSAEVAVAPPFPLLRTVLDGAFGSSLVVGAQNAHGEDQGAFTGEVSCALLGTMGVRFVILGHSERRTLFGETDDAVRVKVCAALRHGIVPLVCVGETEAERDAGRTLEVVRRQVLAALDSDAARGSDAIVVAYEPVWAIGTGRVAAAAQIVEAHRAIRSDLGDAVGRDRASDTRILYGGSVTDRNAPEILALPDVDGALVGGASLDAPRFLAIARAASLPAGSSPC